MRLTISYLSAGPIRIGMTRAEVRELLLTPPGQLPDSTLSELRADYFADGWNLQVLYDGDWACCAIKVFPPTSALFKKRDLLATPYAALVDELKALDANLEVDATSFTSRKFRFRVHAPDPKATPEHVMVFKPDYPGAQ
jgi:hypothetical protein